LFELAEATFDKMTLRMEVGVEWMLFRPRRVVAKYPSAAGRLFNLRRSVMLRS
jgi:hypothetical protein